MRFILGNCYNDISGTRHFSLKWRTPTQKDSLWSWGRLGIRDTASCVLNGEWRSTWKRTKIVTISNTKFSVCWQCMDILGNLLTFAEWTSVCWHCLKQLANVNIRWFHRLTTTYIFRVIWHIFNVTTAQQNGSRTLL